jgi:hypothetical protein
MDELRRRENKRITLIKILEKFWRLSELAQGNGHWGWVCFVNCVLLRENTALTLQNHAAHLNIKLFEQETCRRSADNFISGHHALWVK